jgi:hypothetical protein
MLRSFLDLNAWFEGDIVIVHNGLRHDVRAQLESFPRARFRQVRPELRDRVDHVRRALPAMQRKASIFYSMEA